MPSSTSCDLYRIFLPLYPGTDVVALCEMIGTICDFSFVLLFFVFVFVFVLCVISTLIVFGCGTSNSSLGCRFLGNV